MSKYQPQHAPNKKPRNLWHLVALPVVAALVLLASPAEASKQTPRAGEGWISLVSRTCGNSANWQNIAKANGSSAPRWILPLRSVNVSCPARHEPKASRSTTRPAAWVKPGPGGCSDGFGYRSWRPGEFHYGQDIRTGYGARVVSIAAGKVTAAGWSGGAGNRVWVDHGHGVRSIVMHLSYIAVHAGQSVKAGQLLGRSGSTGDSTGPHLHVGITVNGSYVNPKTFMAKRGVKLC